MRRKYEICYKRIILCPHWPTADNCYVLWARKLDISQGFTWPSLISSSYSKKCFKSGNQKYIKSNFSFSSIPSKNIKNPIYLHSGNLKMFLPSIFLLPPAIAPGPLTPQTFHSSFLPWALSEAMPTWALLCSSFCLCGPACGNRSKLAIFPETLPWP